MATLTLMVGVSGSGKSTIAKKLALASGAKIVSTDAIRGEFGDETRQDLNGFVFQIARNRVQWTLSLGEDVIVDATNVDVKSRKEFVKIGKANGAKIVAAVVAVPVSTAKARNNRRFRVVPDHVIDKQARRLVEPTKAEGFDEVMLLS